MSAQSTSATAIVDGVVERLQKVYPPNHPLTSPAYETPGRMSEASHTDDVSELKIKVGGLENEFGSFSRNFERFVENTEKRFVQSDARAEANAQRVDTKIDAVLAAVTRSQMGREASNSTSLNGKSDNGTQAWLLPAIISVSVAAAGGFLTYVNSVNQGNINDLKHAAEINAQAVAGLNTYIRDVDSRQGAATAKAVTDLAASTNAAIAKAVEPAVPRPELERDFAFMQQQIGTKVDQGVFAKAADYRDDQIKSLRDSVTTLRDQSASKAETSALNERMSTLSNRLNDLVGRFTAVPKDPRLQ